MMNKFIQILLIGICSCMTPNVMALPLISGSFDMYGAAPNVYDAGGSITEDAAAAVKIVFDPGLFLVVAAEGDDLSGLIGQVGTIKELAFDPFTGPIDDFWSVGGFTFDLLNVVRDTSNDPSSVLVLNGTGIISDGNVEFEDTAMLWSFSSDTFGGQFSWNAVSASAVPEPGVLMLLTMGLLGFSLRKRT